MSLNSPRALQKAILLFHLVEMHLKAHSHRAKVKISFDDCCFFFADIFPFRSAFALSMNEPLDECTFLESMFYTANPAVDYIPSGRVMFYTANPAVDYIPSGRVMFYTANPAVDYISFWRVCSAQRTLR